MHLFVQILLPIRHYFIPGYVDWTSEGYYFAWRMKIRSKSGSINLDIKDGKTGESTFVALKSFLNPIQVRAVSDDPLAMIRFLQKLEKIAVDKGIQTPEFYATWECSLNRSELLPVVDPTVNLLQVNYKWYGGNDWILPSPKVKK